MNNIAFFEIESWEKEYLEKSFEDCFFSQSPLKEEDIEKIKDKEILGVFVYSKITKEILDKLPNLKIIVTMSTGFDHIDLKACKEKGVLVSNVPSYGENTVAEHTFALILALSRKIPESVERTRKGDFTLDNLRGFDLKGKTIGIVGTGNIGSHVARMAAGFEMNILAFDIKKNNALFKKYKVKYVNFSFLLENSDIITLHAPYNEKTHHLINKGNIEKIKKGAYLINTSRGGLIETEALILALKKDVLAGAGLDVLEEECFIKEEKELLAGPFQKTCDLKTILQNHLLARDPKVIITPHNAFNSKEALFRILDTTVENINSFLKKKPKNLVD